MCPVLQADLGRNIHIKRFQDVPLADMEMIFPDKRVFLKPLLLLQLFVTIVIGLISVLVTLITVRTSQAQSKLVIEEVTHGEISF